MRWKFQLWFRNNPERYPFRQKLKYRRKSHHRKKENCDDVWREHKQMRRDKSRNYFGYLGWRKADFKLFSSRKERRHVKRMLHRADWDNWQNFSPDYYCDPWGWD